MGMVFWYGLTLSTITKTPQLEVDVPHRVKFLPIDTCFPLGGFVIFTPSEVCCCGKALTEKIQIDDAKRIIIVTENTNFSDMLKVLII